MKGRVSGYDAGTGIGQISGDDGARYNFTKSDLKLGATVSAGAEVDFENAGRHAKDIYVLSVAPWQAAYARPAEPDLGLFALAIIIPGLAVQVRRLHDIGQSGWVLLLMIVLSFIPEVGAFMTIGYIVLGCIKTQPGPNKYGPPQI